MFLERQQDAMTLIKMREMNVNGKGGDAEDEDWKVLTYLGMDVDC